MKRYIPFLLILVACGGSPEEVEEEHNPVTLPDTTDFNEIEPDFVLNTEDSITIPIALKELLDNPIDLQAYKEEYGESNGGGRSYSDDIYKPDTAGQYYRFMLFWKLRQVLPTHPDEGTLFNNFAITVYRYGDRIGDFYDTNEELIMIECAIDNTTLGDLNWYGKKKITLMDKYGAPQYEQDNCMIYYFDHKTITAHLTDGQVDWYKYVRLNEDVDLSEGIPGELLDF